MKLAIMQPYFMPYIGYFQAIKAVDKYILYDRLTYILNGWINKNRIRQRNMPISLISVPIVNRSSNVLIYDTMIDNSKPWSAKMLKGIELSYAKASYKDEVMPLIESMLTPRYTSISELNCETIKKICSFLDIKTVIDSDGSRFLDMEDILANEVEKGLYNSLPYLELTRPIKKVARALEMCRRENANVFVNAIGGIELYSKEEFKQYGIDLYFIKTHSVYYSQKCNDGSFEPNLSIIDVLMHNGKEGTKKLLNEYTLI